MEIDAELLAGICEDTPTPPEAATFPMSLGLLPERASPPVSGRNPSFRQLP